MTVHRFTEATLTIGGVEFGKVTDMSYARVRHRSESKPLYTPGTYEATATMHLTKKQAQPFFDFFDRMERRRQLIERLVRRLAYNNRKGRRAARRLFAMGIFEVGP